MSDDNWKHRSVGMQCQTCMWFVAKKFPVGRCRKNAPEVGNGWPVVFFSDFCGQHKLDETKIEVAQPKPPEDKT